MCADMPLLPLLELVVEGGVAATVYICKHSYRKSFENKACAEKIVNC